MRRLYDERKYVKTGETHPLTGLVRYGWTLIPIGTASDIYMRMQQRFLAFAHIEHEVKNVSVRTL